jgi:hypothetical protein
MEPIKQILFFEKKTGEFAGVLESQEIADNINKDIFVIKEVFLKPNEYWEGNYKDGKIFNRKIVPLVYEQNLLDETYAEILASYPLYKQINVIIDMLEKNIAIQKTDEFTEMVNFIKNRKVKLKQKIKHLSTDKKAFNFIRIQNETSDSNIS